MNPRTTIILLVVLVALVAFVYFTEPGVLGKAEATPTPQPGQSQVLKLDAATINRITVVNLAQQRTTEVAKQDGTWRVIQPVSEDADGPRLDQVAERLADLRSTRKFEGAETDLAGRGLITGTFTITIGVESGADQTLKVGDKDPLGQSYPVQKGDDAAVYLVAAFDIEEVTGFVANPPLKPTPMPTTPPVVLPTIEATPAATTPPAPSATP